MFGLGQVYEEMYDYRNSAKWYLKAAKKGHAGAMFHYGRCLQLGRGLQKDLSTAFFWYGEGAARKDPHAMHARGWLLKHGLGCERDSHAAAFSFLEAARAGFFPAVHQLEITDLVEEVDQLQAFHIFSEGADLGDSYSLLQLGRCYSSGTGANQDFKKALKSFLSAVQAGNQRAISYLASCCQYGIGLPADPELAFALFFLGAQNNDPVSQNNLGCCYYCGRGIKQDKGLAFTYFSLAAENGDLSALSNLGYCYEHGENQNIQKALETYLKGSRQNDPTCTSRLGQLVIRCGVVIAELQIMQQTFQQLDQASLSLSQGLGLIKKAAELGDFPAMMDLAIVIWKA